MKELLPNSLGCWQDDFFFLKSISFIGHLCFGNVCEWESPEEGLGLCLVTAGSS